MKLFSGNKICITNKQTNKQTPSELRDKREMLFCSVYKLPVHLYRAGRLPSREKHLLCKHNNMNLIPRTHSGRREMTPDSCLLTSTCAWYHTRINNKKKFL